MASTALIETLRDSFSNHAGVKTLYGEPVVAEGKTVIPVARISYGFGAGSGNKPDEGSGGGGGGGLSAVPIGVVEVTPAATRFICFRETRKLLGAAGLGMILGMWFGRRRGNRRH